MKRKIILLSLYVVFCTAANAQMGQADPTTLTQEIDYHLDELGDARMELRMKMNAAQWQAFKASPVASNPSVFKRNMEREMSAYVLQDFKTELEEDARASLTTLKAKNTATYKGKGKWEVKLGLKNPNVTAVSDNCYLITGNLASGSGVIHQIQKMFFPEGASDIRQDTDSFGNAIFTYRLDVEKSGINMLSILGGLFCLSGVLLYFLPDKVYKKTSLQHI